MLEPATSIIEKFGGPERVAEIVGTTSGQVRRWRHSKETGGTGGAVPHWHAATLLAHAKGKRIKVKAEDFIATPKVEAAS